MATNIYIVTPHLKKNENIMFLSNSNGFSFLVMILNFFYLLLGHYHSPKCLRIFTFSQLRQRAHGGTEIGQQRMLSPPWRLILHLIFVEAVFALLLFCFFFFWTFEYCSLSPNFIDTAYDSDSNKIKTIWYNYTFFLFELCLELTGIENTTNFPCGYI